MRHLSSSILLSSLLVVLCSACAVKEPSHETAVFGGQGALVKELPLPSSSAAGPAASLPATGPCGAGVTPSDVAVLDDFEDGDGKPFKGYQREAFWYTSTDHSAGSTLAPEGNFMPARLPARESSKDNLFAAHVTAAGQTEWGALFATTLHWLNEGVRCPLNVSLFQGVKFRAKGPGSVAFRMDVPGTMPPEYGGECSKSCYDAPSKVITLSDHWDEYKVTWDQLQQGGWGTEVRFDPARVLGLGFTINLRALPADFWVDDLALIPKATAP